MKTYRAIGLMSGTSLDGLDIAYCEFKNTADQWRYKILAAETIPYNKTLLRALSEADKQTAEDLAHLHSSYGAWTGKEVVSFISRHNLKPTLVASHGHTVFHQPERGFTVQIGSGAEIAVASGLTTVCDFRSTDVALGGQGAPLVPIGDELLFPQYDYCLNLGGFANISYRRKASRLAFDICPVNIILNNLSRQLHKPYDKDGHLARKGKLNETLFENLGAATFFQLKGPKSLGKEWVTKTVLPILEKSQLPIEDQLHTYVMHVAEQINSHLDQKNTTLLVTGGGVYNSFLMEQVSLNCNARITIPNDILIQFREALIFAFLGVLRVEGKTNCLKSVTGARADSVGGCVYA
jgi:anhydro-N-acetylmuramic acid kinase